MSINSFADNLINSNNSIDMSYENENDLAHDREGGLKKVVNSFSSSNEINNNFLFLNDVVANATNHETDLLINNNISLQVPVNNNLQNLSVMMQEMHGVNSSADNVLNNLNNNCADLNHVISNVIQDAWEENEAYRNSRENQSSSNSNAEENNNDMGSNSVTKFLPINPRSVEEDHAIILQRSSSASSKSSNTKYKCMYCPFIFVGGPQKIRVHLTGRRENGTRLSKCLNCPEEVRKLMEMR